MGIARRRSDPREQPRGHDRIREHARSGLSAGAAAGRQPRHNVRAQQGTHLVAAQHAPGAGVRILRGHRGAVGVGVIGDHDVRVHADGGFERQVQGAGLFRVREGHRGEVGVRFGLLAHQRDVGEAGGVEHRHCGLAAHTMHGGQDDFEVAGREVLRDGQRRDGGLVVGRDGRIQGGPPLRGQGDAGQLTNGVDLGGDQGVVRRHDLRAASALLDGVPAQVDLVAVVLGRVVAGRDHHAAVALQRPHGIGEQRCGQSGRHQERLDAGRGENRRGFFRKDVRVVAGVEADDGARPGTGGGLRDGVGQEGGEPGGGAAHHHAVHPVGARAEGGPQACGAELQGPAETVGELLAGRGGAAVGQPDQLGQGGGGGGIRVLGGPGAGFAQQAGEFGIRRRHRNQTSANRGGCLPRQARVRLTDRSRPP